MQQHGFRGPPVLSSLFLVSAACRVWGCLPWSCSLFPGTAAALRPEDDFSKLRVKQLRELLLAHGETCEGCVEKIDFERKLREAVVAAQGGRWREARAWLEVVQRFPLLVVTIDWNEDGKCWRRGAHVRRECARAGVPIWTRAQPMPFRMVVRTFWVLCWPARKYWDFFVKCLCCSVPCLHCTYGVLLWIIVSPSRTNGPIL